MKKKPISLKWGLVTTIVLCWIVPVLIIAGVAGVLLDASYRRAVQQEMNTGARAAIRQVQTHLSDAINASKAVSYDGVMEKEYRAYCDSGDSVALYRNVSSYLKLSFSWDSNVQAVFTEFTDPEVGVSPSFVSGGIYTTAIQNSYRLCRDRIAEKLASADTEIFFMLLDGDLYMVRNLLDSKFDVYANVVLLLDESVIFRAMETLPMADNVLITLDECCFRLSDGYVLANPAAIPGEESDDVTVRFTGEADGHQITFTADTIAFDMWRDTPAIRAAVAGVALLVIPLLAFIVLLFYRHITRPMEVLSLANQRVRAGERGFQIRDVPPNTEFRKLYHNFNGMSEELERQFQRARLEQQATQRAKIKALQSQINPHFLNNTLEIINWEARMAENDRVCAMIEALSTMLDAALDRNGRVQVPLRDELRYVDAYLYIICQRLGDSFRVTRDIEPAVLDQCVPLLLLQPIVENAVEHDITPRRGGDLCVRAFREGDSVVMEVRRDGTISPEDRMNIDRILAEQPVEDMDRGQVGLQNVSHRLRLIYGENSGFSITEPVPGTVVARVTVPYLPDVEKDSKHGQ